MYFRSIPGAHGNKITYLESTIRKNYIFSQFSHWKKNWNVTRKGTPNSVLYIVYTPSSNNHEWLHFKIQHPNKNPINLFVFCIRLPKYYVQIITRYHKFTSIMRFNFGLVFVIYYTRANANGNGCECDCGCGYTGCGCAWIKSIQFYGIYYNAVEFTHLPINYMSCVEKRKRWMA